MRRDNEPEDSGPSTSEIQRIERGMDRTLHAPNTEAGRAFNTLGNSSDPADVREFGSIATDNRHVVDEYSLSETERKALGIRDEEHIVYVARDSVMPRRFQTVVHRYGGGRVIVDPKTKQDPCEHMDVMMVAVPKDAYRQREAERERRAAEYNAQFRPRGGHLERETKLFDADDEDGLRMRRAMNEQAFEEMGIGSNGPTSGMTLEEGLQFLKRSGIDPEVLADQARSGGAHRRDNRQMFSAAMRGESSRGKQFTTGGAEFAPQVNPRSALGQVQQRNSRQQAGATREKGG